MNIPLFIILVCIIVAVALWMGKKRGAEQRRVAAPKTQMSAESNTQQTAPKMPPLLKKATTQASIENGQKKTIGNTSIEFGGSVHPVRNGSLSDEIVGADISLISDGETFSNQVAVGESIGLGGVVVEKISVIDDCLEFTAHTAPVEFKPMEYGVAFEAKLGTKYTFNENDWVELVRVSPWQSVILAKFGDIAHFQELGAEGRRTDEHTYKVVKRGADGQSLTLIVSKNSSDDKATPVKLGEEFKLSFGEYAQLPNGIRITLRYCIEEMRYAETECQLIVNTKEEYSRTFLYFEKNGGRKRESKMFFGRNYSFVVSEIMTEPKTEVRVKVIQKKAHGRFELGKSFSATSGKSYEGPSGEVFVYLGREHRSSYGAEGEMYNEAWADFSWVAGAKQIQFREDLSNEVEQDSDDSDGIDVGNYLVKTMGYSGAYSGESVVEVVITRK